MMNLKISKSVDSVLEKLELVELIDIEILDKLINSNLLQTTKWEAGLITFENEKHQLHRYTTFYVRTLCLNTFSFKRGRKLIRTG